MVTDDGRIPAEVVETVRAAVLAKLNEIAGMFSGPTQVALVMRTPPLHDRAGLELVLSNHADWATVIETLENTRDGKGEASVHAVCNETQGVH